jgi:hypothetical protein
MPIHKLSKMRAFYKFQPVVQQIMSSLTNVTQSYMILTICTKPNSVHIYLQLAKTTLMMTDPKQATHYQNSLRNKFSSRFQLLRELVYKWTNFVIPTEGEGQQIHVLMLTTNGWTRHKHEITDSNLGKYGASSNLICTMIFAGYSHATSSHFVLLCRVHTLHDTHAIKMIQNLEVCKEYTDTAPSAHKINK